MSSKIFLILLSFGLAKIANCHLENLKPHSMKFQVRIFGPKYCEGALINGYTVLTAADCLRDQPAGTVFKVIAGDYDFRVTEDSEQIKNGTDYILDDLDPLNNIGLLKVKEPFKFNEYVTPASLPASFQEFTGQSMVSGWSFFGTDNLYQVQMGANVTLVDDQTCKEEVQKVLNMMVGYANICAIGDDQSFCPTASGSPLTCGEDKYLCGIAVDAPKACHKPQLPGVFTQISNHVDFIMDNL